MIHAAPCAVAIAPAGYTQTAGARQPLGLVAAAVDGGGETERVVRVAAQIARGAGATLRLVTAVDVPYTHGPIGAGQIGYRAIHGDVADAAEEVLERGAGAAAADVDVDRRVAAGRVVEEVARQSEGAGLLVIGSRGYGPLRRIVMGSTTGKILQAVSCPAIVVPRQAAEELDDAVVPLGTATLQASSAAASGEVANG